MVTGKHQRTADDCKTGDSKTGDSKTAVGERSMRHPVLTANNMERQEDRTV